MKYTLEGFSQEVLISLNLDIQDAVILRWFIDFSNTSKMRTINKDDRTWYWVKYDGVLNDLPILGTSKKTIQRRFGNLVKAKVLLHHTHKRGGTFSYFTINPTVYTSLVSSNKHQANEEYKRASSPTKTKLSEPSDKTVLPNNYSIKDTSIRNINNETVSKGSGILTLEFSHFLDFYNIFYEFYEGKKHPYIKQEQLLKVQKAIKTSGIYAHGEEGIKIMLEDYFVTVKGDHNINHFVSGDIIEMRISRFMTGNCLKEATLRNQIEHLQRVKAFNQDYLSLLSLFAKKYREHKREDHPAVKLQYLKDYEHTLADTRDSLEYLDEEVWDNYFRQATFSNHRLGFFASEGVQYIIHCRMM